MPKELAFWVPPHFDDEGLQIRSGIGADGKEYPSDVPVEVPVEEYNPGQEMLDTVRRLMSSEFLRAKADTEGFDTPEEADDFDDEDDEFVLTEYQRMLMERDLNPDPALLKRSADPGQVSEGARGAPPPEVSKDGVSADRGKLGNTVVSNTGTVEVKKLAE